MGPTCKQFFVFTLVVLIIIPLIVYAISAVFTTILWYIECEEWKKAQEEEEEDLGSGFAPPPSPPNLLQTEQYDMCNWYEWFKYVVGNLVGVSLTNVGDGLSGHFVAEIVDIVVSTWSVALIGSVVGLVGGLGLMSTMAEKINATAADVAAVRKDAIKKAKGDGLDFKGFNEMVQQRRLPLTDAQAKSMFKMADKNSDGTIDKKECAKLLELLEMAVPADRRDAGGGGGGGGGGGKGGGGRGGGGSGLQSGSDAYGRFVAQQRRR